MTDDPKKTDASEDEDKSEGWDEAEKVADSIRPPPPPAPEKEESEDEESDEEEAPAGHDEDDVDGDEHRDHLARDAANADHEHHDHEGDDDDAVPAREPKKRPALLLAQFDTTADVLHAAEKVRDAGYTQWDTHSPFPIHGMDKAMGLKDSFLGLLVFVGGLTGVTTAVVMIWWMNGVDYPIIIGGKPPFSLPSMVPIMFELTILFTAFATVFGMFHLNRLPRHHHPVFNSDRFTGATDDKFFLSVEADDPKFDLEKTKKLFEDAHCTHLEIVYDDDGPAEAVSLGHAEA